MSFGSSGRYQSRLFNFVNQQSRRLTEQWESTFRHLQVATKWGVELLLYPVYSLFHSAELDGKVLPTTESKSKRTLQASHTDFSPETPLTTDTPIQHVLAAVQNLPREENRVTPQIKSLPLKLWGFWRSQFLTQPTTPDFPTSLALTDNNSALEPDIREEHRPMVRGIATNLSDRHLVLVTADNQILDILTSQQQARLTDKIISEISNYWYSWRLSQNQTELLPEIERLLAKLTGDRNNDTPLIAGGTVKNLLDKSKLFVFLDVAVAKLEETTLVPVQKSSQKLAQVAQTQLSIFLYGQEQLNAKREITVHNNGLETHTPSFSALIEAALNYFFGVGKDKQIDFRVPDVHEVLAPDPWLNWSDLFGNSKMVSQLNYRKNSHPIVSSQPKADAELTSGKESINSSTSNSQKSGKASSTKNSPNPNFPAKSHHRSRKTSQRQLSQSTQIEAKPDWIETKATLMGYEKHPLEQLLQWLDRAMLWLEEILVKIFQSFQRLWQGK